MERSITLSAWINVFGKLFLSGPIEGRTDRFHEEKKTMTNVSFNTMREIERVVNY